MNKLTKNFESEGYAVIEDILSALQLQTLPDECDKLMDDKAGTRNLLKIEWVRDLAKEISRHNKIASLLPENAVPVQCTYFSKNTDKNWLVPIHRDLSIPVAEKFTKESWSGWSVKEGINYVQPPSTVLKSLLAIRVHLENNTAENGELQVVPGSHLDKSIEKERVLCEVPKGGALVLRPLLLHASSKLESGTRRVLPFLYGPATLPSPAKWAYAV